MSSGRAGRVEFILQAAGLMHGFHVRVSCVILLVGWLSIVLAWRLPVTCGQRDIGSAAAAVCGVQSDTRDSGGCRTTGSDVQSCNARGGTARAAPAGTPTSAGGGPVPASLRADALTAIDVDARGAGRRTSHGRRARGVLVRRRIGGGRRRRWTMLSARRRVRGVVA